MEEIIRISLTGKRIWRLQQKITDELNKICPGFAREVKIKDGRYNQHMSPNAILIEVGHHENTLQEALNAVPYIAEAIMNVIGDS